MSKLVAKKSLEWDYENGFYLTSDVSRIGKLVAHLELYKKITSIPGDVMEFGVFKGASLIRWVSFRDLLEYPSSRSVVGFDIFGEFPQDVQAEDDHSFIGMFEDICGDGISKAELNDHLLTKGCSNYDLIEGDVMKTLPVYLDNNPALRIALLHIDIDMYKPTLLILELLWSRIVKGGILVLDDYGVVEGETVAVDQFFKDNSVDFKKLKYHHTPTYIVMK